MHFGDERRRIRRTWRAGVQTSLALVAWGLGAGCSEADTEAQDAAVDSARFDFVVSGRVTTDDGQPIVAALVAWAGPMFTIYETLPIPNGTGLDPTVDVSKAPWTVATDVDGSFEIGLPGAYAGPNGFVVQASGHLPRAIEVVVPTPPRRPAPIEVVLEAGEIELKAPLWEGDAASEWAAVEQQADDRTTTSVRVRVVDARGEPLPDVFVVGGRLEAGRRPRTDADGVVRIDGLTIGRWRAFSAIAPRGDAPGFVFVGAADEDGDRVWIEPGMGSVEVVAR
jgi:hypothetical protein